MDQKVALEAIDSYVNAHADEVVAFLKEFIAIRSVTYEEGASMRLETPSVASAAGRPRCCTTRTSTPSNPAILPSGA
jgi:hypothetical protein